MNIPEHPEIECAMRTGYPSWEQEVDEPIYCGECGRRLDEDEVYGDEGYKLLCKDCLLMLHKKEKNMFGEWG